MPYSSPIYLVPLDSRTFEPGLGRSRSSPHERAPDCGLALERLVPLPGGGGWTTGSVPGPEPAAESVAVAVAVTAPVTVAVAEAVSAPTPVILRSEGL